MTFYFYDGRLDDIKILKHISPYLRERLGKTWSNQPAFNNRPPRGSFVTDNIEAMVSHLHAHRGYIVGSKPYRQPKNVIRAEIANIKA